MHAYMLKAVTAAMIASSADNVLGGAMERYATYRATSQGDKSGASLSKEFKEARSVSGKMKLLYRGFWASTLKSSVAFAIFFIAAKPIQSKIKQVFSIKDDAATPWHVTFMSAAATGFAVALGSSPIDIIKTQKQMPNPSNRTVAQALKSNIRTFGFSGAFAGLPSKMLLITLGWGLNFIVTQRDTTETKNTPTLRR